MYDAYLRGGADCPEAVIQDEAVIRTAGHVKDRRTFGIQEGRLETGRRCADELVAGRRGLGSPVRRRGVAGAVREAVSMIELGIGQPPRRPEIRSDATSLAINLLTAAVGATAAQTWAAGAVEVAAGLWARSLSTAAVSGAPVGPRWLAETGRALARTGQAVYLVDVAATGPSEAADGPRQRTYGATDPIRPTGGIG